MWLLDGMYRFHSDVMIGLISIVFCTLEYGNTTSRVWKIPQAE